MHTSTCSFCNKPAPRFTSLLKDLGPLLIKSLEKALGSENSSITPLMICRVKAPPLVVSLAKASSPLFVHSKLVSLAAEPQAIWLCTWRVMQFQSYEHPIRLRSFTEALAKESTGNCERRRQHEAVLPRTQKVQWSKLHIRQNCQVSKASHPLLTKV